MSTKRISSLFILLLLVSFVIVGCERPDPFGGGEEEAATATPDPNAGGGDNGPGIAEQPETAPEAEPIDEGPAESEIVEGTTEESSAEEPAVAESAETEADTPAMEEAEAVVEENEMEDESEEAMDEVVSEGEETAISEEDSTETTDTDSEETPSESEGSTTSQPADTNTPSNTSPMPPIGNCPVTHTVQAGQNLYRIGLQYGMSWVPIANANGLANPNAIYVGQVLVIPVAGCAPVPPPPVPPIPGTTYVVQYGDTLYSIGLKYGVSWVQIAEANGIVNPNQIYAGQVLKIPAAQPGPTPNFTHLVQYGETLYTISIHYGVPWQAIATANQIPAPYIVYAGQTIIIPGSW